MDKVSSQNDQSVSQTFACFKWVHLPTNPYCPQARRTGLIGPEPSLHHFDFCGICACLPLVPPPIWYGQGAGGRLLFYPITLLAFHTLHVEPPPATPTDYFTVTKLQVLLSLTERRILMISKGYNNSCKLISYIKHKTEWVTF